MGKTADLQSRVSAAISASVSAVKRLIATTTGSPNFWRFSAWRWRLAKPFSTASTFSKTSSSLVLTPPCHLSAPDRCDQNRRVGLHAGLAHLDVEELLRAQIRREARFRDADVAEREREPGGLDGAAAVRDVGERAAVQNRRSSFRGLHQVRGETRRAGAPSARPAIPSSPIVTGSFSRFVPTTVRASRAFKSPSDSARQSVAMTSLAAVISKPVSDGTPSLLPPRPETIFRKARSFMSRQRFQVTLRGSIPRALPD